jgi:Tol biopolymer transport system component/DNA-binding winged helix-turn-helix (wHTH) protein
VEKAIQNAQVVRFATFEVDLRAGELRKAGLRLKLSGQPFQVLAILLQQRGEVVTREELQQRLWPDTFVDVDHNLNTAINKIREALGDTAENPRFIETLPRRGYRFSSSIDDAGSSEKRADAADDKPSLRPRRFTLGLSISVALGVLVVGTALFIYLERPAPAVPRQRSLTPLTFDDGLQIGATWSPDGRFIAYSSDRGGKSDIWVKQVSGSDPVRITKGPGQNWQPDWSPDGKYIAYRSEDGDGGLFVVPALGGSGLERKVSSFGYFPLWSPDSTRILFRKHFTTLGLGTDRFYVVGLDGGDPHSVLADFKGPQGLEADSAAWHPDGKRISLWAWDREAGRSLWTVPLAGGVAVKSEIAPEIIRQLEEVSVGRGIVESGTWDFKFSWAPSGKAIYFERTFRGANNLWKMIIDPDTMRATAIERLTTGSGLDTQLDVSADGKKLAFTVESLHVRAWLFPFDATRGRVTGSGQAVTSLGVNAWMQNLSRDGTRLAFSNYRFGKMELWEKSLLDGHEAPIVTDEYVRVAPQWSPDGKSLTYQRSNPSTGENQVMVWSGQSRNEEPATESRTADQYVYDWSPDGQRLLVSIERSDDHLHEIWLMPVTAGEAHAEPAAQKIISDSGYDLFQPHFSPDGRWIVFEAIRQAPKIESILYVMPAGGGPWSRISQGKYWDDKPCWAPDGKTIYFVSGGGGFFNVWGIRFDQATGKSVGKAFRITALENPGRMIPNTISLVGLSLNQNKLVLTVEERSGGIWVLDNVDQ